MSTNLTSATSYLTPTLFVTEFYDARQCADLLSIDGTRVGAGGTAAAPTVDTAVVAADPKVQRALNVASGEVEKACLVGNRYSPTDLAGLEGMAQASLQGLVADLAFWQLLKWRYPAMQETDTFKAAQETLQQLRDGSRIFGIQENADAGLPATTFVTQQSIDTLNLNSTIARRFFGSRGKERRIGP